MRWLAAGLVVMFIVTGQFWLGYQCYSVDETERLLTARRVAAAGTIYWDDAILAEFHAGYPWKLIYRTSIGGQYYSKYEASTAALLGGLLAVDRRLVVLFNLPWLLLILYILRRLARDWQAGPVVCALAAVWLVFGSTVAAWWFGYYPYIMLGALALAALYCFERNRLLPAVLALVLAVWTRGEAVLFLLPAGLLALRRLPAGSRRLAAAALFAGLLLGGGLLASHNLVKTGNIIDSGELQPHFDSALVSRDAQLDRENIARGRWRLEWLAGMATQLNENFLLCNALLLVLLFDWRRLAPALPYLAAAVGAFLVYATWYGWATGYFRLFPAAVILAVPGLLLIRWRGFAYTLLLVGIVINGAFFFVSGEDCAATYISAQDSMAGERAAALAEPLYPLHTMTCLARGLLP